MTWLRMTYETRPSNDWHQVLAPRVAGCRHNGRMTTADRPGSTGPGLAAIAAAAASDAGDLDPGLLGDFLEQVVAAAATQRRLRRLELARCTAAGRRAAVEGVALRALVDLYLSAAWRLWRDAPELTAGGADQVRAAGLAVLRATDDGVAALAEGFQLARVDVARQPRGCPARRPGRAAGGRTGDGGGDRARR